MLVELLLGESRKKKPPRGWRDKVPPDYTENEQQVKSVGSRVQGQIVQSRGAYALVLLVLLLGHIMREKPPRGDGMDVDAPDAGKSCLGIRV